MLKRKKKTQEELNNIKTSIDKRNNFFLSIWNERPHKSEIDGTYLGNNPLTIYFHHVLSKKKYPEFEYYKKNIILLTGDQHATVEINSDKYQKINELRKELLEDYFFMTNPEYVKTIY